MKKRRSKETQNVVYRLRSIAHKLQGLGYLVARDHSVGFEPVPEVREGIGSILEELGLEVRELSNQLDLSEKS